jgi:diguanylate cyclase (GGDEF)-like protein
MHLGVAHQRYRMTYAFTDPLGAADPATTRRRIRHAHVLVYGAAAPTLLIALIADGGPLSQRLAAGAAALFTLVVALLLLAWRAPDWLLLVAFPIATLTVTAVAVLDPPLALTPMFYVWPLLTASYFLQRRELYLTYLTVCASFGAVSLWALDEGPRLIQWITVAVVAGVMVVFVGALKTGLDELVQRLHRLAREDPLTGALNRRAFVERLDAELARADRTGASCALATIDVDHFKDINDRYGHAAGDDALRGLVATISRRRRRSDALGRLGGEEFAVLLTDATIADAERYADELRALVRADAVSRGTPFTISVGVTAVTTPGSTAEDLLVAADAALYRAKRAGRDTVRAA